jgi:hypothetical protein
MVTAAVGVRKDPDPVARGSGCRRHPARSAPHALDAARAHHRAATNLTNLPRDFATYHPLTVEARHA